jgi:hypothetical protein
MNLFISIAALFPSFFIILIPLLLDNDIAVAFAEPDEERYNISISKYSRFSREDQWTKKVYNATDVSYVSCFRYDGVGAHLLCSMSAIIACTLNPSAYTYVHIPLNHFENNHRTNRTVTENFFSLSDGEIKLAEFPFEPKRIKVTESAGNFGREHPEYFDLFRAEFSRRYFLTRKPTIKEFKVE